LLVAEASSDSAGDLSFEQNISDTVIRLFLDTRQGYTQRYFEIMKSRFQREQRGEHPFSIWAGAGIHIFPSSAAIGARIRTRKIPPVGKSLKFGLQSLDDILGSDP